MYTLTRPLNRIANWYYFKVSLSFSLNTFQVADPKKQTQIVYHKFSKRTKHSNSLTASTAKSKNSIKTNLFFFYNDENSIIASLANLKFPANSYEKTYERSI